jgi:hypothetical protein
MAKLSALVEQMASLLGLPGAVVLQHARHVREAGYIVQGGRGTGAPDVGVADSSNLLINIIAGREAKDARATVRRYRAVGFKDFRYRRVENARLNISGEHLTEELFGNGAPTALGFLNNKHHDLGGALESLIGAAVAGSLQQLLQRFDNGYIELEIRAPVPTAVFRIGQGTDLPLMWASYDFYAGNPSTKDRKQVDALWRGGDLSTAHKITDKTIFGLGGLIAGRLEGKIDD